jgi:hypothetical protein
MVLHSTPSVTAGGGGMIGGNSMMMGSQEVPMVSAGLGGSSDHSVRKTWLWN